MEKPAEIGSNTIVLVVKHDPLGCEIKILHLEGASQQLRAIVKIDGWISLQPLGDLIFDSVLDRFHTSGIIHKEVPRT